MQAHACVNRAGMGFRNAICKRATLLYKISNDRSANELADIREWVVDCSPVSAGGSNLAFWCIVVVNGSYNGE